MSERERELRALLVRHVDRAETVREVREPLYDTACARLSVGTPASKLGISVDTVQPGKAACPYHFHHAQEEAFVILAGRGTLRIAGERLLLEAGDVVFVPPGPAYPHQILNTSDGALTYLSIGTRDLPEIVEYPESDKVLFQSAAPGGGSTPPVSRMQRRGEPVDYWDGEP